MSFRFNGGINYEIINDYFNQILNQNLKLSLFLGLDCKPMKDVIFFPATNKLSVGDIDCLQLGRMFSYIDARKEGIYIEAIPEKLTDEEFVAKDMTVNGAEIHDKWLEYYGENGGYHDRNNL